MEMDNFYDVEGHWTSKFEAVDARFLFQVLRGSIRIIFFLALTNFSKPEYVC